MSQAPLVGNEEKNGTQRDVNSSLPEVGRIYSPAICFIYIIHKCRGFTHDSTVTFFSRYACDMVWGYFPFTGIYNIELENLVSFSFLVKRCRC